MRLDTPALDTEALSAPTVQDSLSCRELAHLPESLRPLWDSTVAGRSVALRSAFWDVLEQGQLNDFRYRYLLLEAAGGTALALAVAYEITTDIAIFAPRPLRRVLKGIRRFWPGFLQWKMLECGTPITMTSPPWEVLPAERATELVPILLQHLRRMARRDGQSLIILRDFEPNAADWQETLEDLGYHWIPSLPNTYLPIRWATPAAYLQDMRSYYRSKLQKYLRRNREQGVHHRLVTEFADLAETLCRQWVEVHVHAKEFQREVLTAEFYRALSENPDVDAQVLLFYRHEHLAGHALLLRDHDMLRWLYVGREASVNDGLYLYIAYTVVETAILQGVQRLELGLTTYAVKQDLGAEVVPIAMALRATWGWMNPFVGWGYRLLNQVPETHPRPVFKQGAGGQ